MGYTSNPAEGRAFECQPIRPIQNFRPFYVNLQRALPVATVWSFAMLLCLSCLQAGERDESLRVAVAKLKLPGVHINLDERCVDVDSEVCLDTGSLELLACTKDTKEHESIVMVEASGMNIHTALLLLGAKPGHPAMRKIIEEDEGRWVDFPPKGGKVRVSLVMQGSTGKPVEKPISDFIRSSAAVEGGKPGRFPTNTFVFAGSHLGESGAGPKKYLADGSGNIISISTFGDELLCLPTVSMHDNSSLIWEVDSEKIPKVGTKVTLRLRPVLQAQPKSGRK